MKRQKNHLLQLGLILAVVLLVLAAIPMGQAAQTTPVTPQQVDGVYQIGTAAELLGFAELVNGGQTDADAILTGDIDLNPGYIFGTNGTVTLNGETVTSGWQGWTPIGINGYYLGTFDGAGYTISGIQNGSYGTYVALVAQLGTEGVVKNVHLVNGHLFGDNHTGGVVGYNTGTVTNCSASFRIQGADAVGGVVGTNRGTVDRCAAYGSVRGKWYVGGVAGDNHGSVTNCGNTSTVLGNKYTGGVVGRNKSIVSLSHNSSSVEGENYVGGVAGTNEGSIRNCYYLYDCADAAYSSCKQYGIGCEVFYGGLRYLEDVKDRTTGRYVEDFSTGAMACLLQSLQSSDAGQVWGQTIGVDTAPRPGGDVVYNMNGGYTNDPNHTAHTVVNGFCTECSYYETPAYSSSTGYQIDNAGKLYYIMLLSKRSWDWDGVLTADIDLNPGYTFHSDGTVSYEGQTVTSGWRRWTSIGTKDKNHLGNFDGNGHTIRGIYVDTPDVEYAGMFGYTSGDIRGLNLENSWIRGGMFTGGIAGGAGAVENCSFSGTVTGTTYVGGIVGSCYDVYNCVNTGSVTGEDNVGGICGNGGMTKNCLNIGTVRASDTNAGAICGQSNKVIRNCFYLAGSARDGSGTEQLGVGADTLGEINDKDAFWIEAVTAEDLASGRVANRLHMGQVVEYEPQLPHRWGQKLGEDPIPRFSSDTVFLVDGQYLNLPDHTVHTYDENGICTVCRSAFEEPVWNYTESYYEVSNAGNLFWVASKDTDSTGYFVCITEDIDLNPGYTFCQDGTVTLNGEAVNHGWLEWAPIGHWKDRYFGDINAENVFTGSTIRGVYCQWSGARSAALVYNLASGSSINNLTLDNSYFSGSPSAGFVIESYGQIMHCTNRAWVNGNNSSAAGIVCRSFNTISWCENDAPIVANYSAGGIVQFARNSIYACINRGEITAGSAGGIAESTYCMMVDRCINTGNIYSSSHAGGIVASDADSDISDCYNTGIIRTENSWGYTYGYAGGIAGSSTGSIYRCGNTGSVYSTGYRGGIAGEIYDEAISLCFSYALLDGETAHSGGIVGVNEGAVLKNCYYLTDPAQEGLVCVGVGEDADGNPVADAANTVEGKDAQWFTNGCLGYQLCGADSFIYWSQDLDVDPHPVLDLYKERSCVYKGYVDNCDPVYSNTEFDITTPLHHMTETQAKEANCTNNGNIAYYTCGHCGNVYLDAQGNTQTTLEDTALPATGVHDFSGESRVCVCGLTEEQWVNGMASITGFSLSFESKIQVNLYYTVTSPTEFLEHGVLVYYQAVTTPDITTADEVYASTGETDAAGNFCANTQGIPAKKLGDTRYYIVYLKRSDGTYAYSAAKTYSPRQYAMSRLEKSSNEKLKALCAAMLNYGAAAQVQFGYRSEDLMNTGMTAEQQALVAAYSADLFTGAKPGDNSKVNSSWITEGVFDSRSASVSFESDFSLNFYLDPTMEPEGDLTLYYWNQEDYDQAEILNGSSATGKVTMVAQDNGKYWAQISDIPAKDLDSTFYVIVYYDDGVSDCSSGIISYSVSQYCLRTIANGSSMTPLCQAAAMYGYYAKSYFEA